MNVAIGQTYIWPIVGVPKGQEAIGTSFQRKVGRFTEQVERPNSTSIRPLVVNASTRHAGIVLVHVSVQILLGYAHRQSAG